MRVVGRPDNELQGYANARKPYRQWESTTAGARWSNMADVKMSRADVDRVGDCYVFNIGGNKFRLITKIRFAKAEHQGVVRVLKLLTHKAYDRGAWKEDC